MSLTNYQDISKVGSSMNAGFQFDFYCGNCPHRWRSPFKPYRRGQLSGLIYKFAYFLDRYGRMSEATSWVSDAGEKRARDAALEEAIALAEPRYTECPSCKKIVCEDCWDQRSGRCEACRGKAGQASGTRASSDAGQAGAGPECPNCRAPFGGGRFCAECGFDMASTHKSCPGCGAMCTRSARFCTDCGHGF